MSRSQVQKLFGSSPKRLRKVTEDKVRRARRMAETWIQSQVPSFEHTYEIAAPNVRKIIK